MDDPSTIEGPVLGGKPTQIKLLSSPQFKAYPYLDKFFAWVNPTFMRAHSHLMSTENPDGTETRRFETVDKMLEELAMPEGFTYLITSKPEDGLSNGHAERESRGPEIFATVSGRPFKGTRATETYAGDRDARLHAEFSAQGIQQWEIKTVIVGGNLQGHGLGKIVMNLAEAEFVRRFQVAKLQHAQEGRVDEGSWRGVQAMLTTVTEVNAGFYEKCGYRKWEVTTIPEGSFFSNNEFEVSWMIKDLPC